MALNRLSNYNWDNVAAVEEAIKKENKDNTRLKKTHTLMQTNASRDVKVTDKSREECTRVLLR